jgi:hypothetical protein
MSWSLNAKDIRFKPTPMPLLKVKAGIGISNETTINPIFYAGLDILMKSKKKKLSFIGIDYLHHTDNESFTYLQVNDFAYKWTLNSLAIGKYWELTKPLSTIKLSLGPNIVFNSYSKRLVTVDPFIQENFINTASLNNLQIGLKTSANLWLTARTSIYIEYHRRGWANDILPKHFGVVGLQYHIIRFPKRLFPNFNQLLI